MRPLKRGQVWTIPTVGRDRTFMIVQNDHVAALHPGAALCALVDTIGDRQESLVTVRITSPVAGVVLAPDLYTSRHRRFEQGTYLGEVDPEEMELVDVALRAVLGL
ncbi:type II toxin-antitoxin system PemK/MazF family toxin [Streptomyces sp. SID3343]|uniref:type II toxin-antitoxin system PemK/MazF family toxin n=1 Tax=Streptomyces sp. SID3343 TaxID=2690260 RepID=UPI00136B7500|nr:type II toxin-antitoxin system PemK/MazF family toxin [Streptomyces sp. SID3343]MYW04856.1 hypothetical protein [Streptomyces sp. SID3343]